MARKTVATVKSAPVKISALDKKFIAQAEARVPTPGCEKEWERVLAGMREQAEADARLDAVSKIVEKEGGSSTAKHWPDFQVALKESSAVGHRVMGLVDAYVYKERHINDAKLVPEEELRVIVIDSLSDKIEELQFEFNYGMLGSKVAQAIRKDVIESEAVAPPLCPDCSLYFDTETWQEVCDREREERESIGA